MTFSGSALRTVVALSLRDIAQDRVMTGLTLGLFATLFLPTLLIFTLKEGVISAWAQDLSRDVWSREVILRGENDGLTPERVAEIAVWPETGFVVPEPLHLIKTRNLRRLTPDRGSWEQIEVRTTAAEDPLLQGAAPPDGAQIVLSYESAMRLGVKTGDILAIMLRRTCAGSDSETELLEVQVTHVIDRAVWEAGGAFLATGVTMGLQAWTICGLEAFGGVTKHQPDPTADSWRSLRIYAPSVRATPALESRLQAEGFETRLRAAAVEDLVNIETGLTVIFRNLLVFNALSFGLAAFLMQWLGVRRKLPDLALMAVAGFAPGELRVFPVAQGIILTAAAFALACGTALALARPLGHLIASYVTDGSIVLPSLWSYGAFGLGATGLALLASVLAVQTIGPDDITRNLRSD